MNQGLTLEAVTRKVLDLRTLQADFRVPQGLLVPSVTKNDIILTIPNGNGGFRATANRHATNQLLETLDIPNRYASLLRDEQPDLLETNLRDRLASPKASNEVRFIRTYRSPIGEAQMTLRAVLSSKFRVGLDNWDLVKGIIPYLTEKGLKVKTAEVTDKRLYIVAIDEKAYAAVQGSKVADDLIAPGIIISNSEVGSGSFNIALAYWRKICNNGAIAERITRRNHVGRRNLGNGGNGDDNSFEVNYSDDTQMLMDAAFWAQIRDTMTAALDTTNFEQIMLRLGHMTKIELPHPQKAVEIISKDHALSEAEKDAMMDSLFRSGDPTVYGLWNALTSVAHTVKDYDRAIEIERLGGDFMQQTDFSKFSAN